MYSTYLRTAMEPRFRRRWGFLAYLPLVLIPTLVVLGSMYAFILLLTGFFSGPRFTSRTRRSSSPRPIA